MSRMLARLSPLATSSLLRYVFSLVDKLFVADVDFKNTVSAVGHAQSVDPSNANAYKAVDGSSTSSLG